MKSFIAKYYQELVIFLLTGIIFVLNLTPGAYLTGWDNLQTELDPVLGIKRAFFSVWQEYQSFGLTAGMGHAADLVRTVAILALSVILPNWLVRYTFHMLMFLLAGLGALFFLRQTGLEGKKRPFALGGSVFYILNFASLQMMFLPFEAFSVFFASLPWLLWILFKGMKEKTVTPRYWLLFTLVNFLATPFSVAQQLFVVYGMILGLITIGFLLQRLHYPQLLPPFRNGSNHESRSKNQEKTPQHPHDSYFILHDSRHGNNNALTILRRSIIAAMLIFAVNAFWLLPQIYFLLTNGSVIQESKINQIATQDVRYSNQDRGNFTDFLTFTGFFYDRLDQDQELLFGAWKAHRENPVMVGILYFTTGIVLLGIFKKSTLRLPFLLVLLLLGVALLSNTEPFTTINEILRKDSFINQVFRSPFTKFAIPSALVSAYFSSYGLALLSQVRRHVHQIKHREILVSFVFIFLLLFQALPVFQGQYFSPRMNVQIPDAYFQALKYVQTVDKESRITMLPDYTFWGWFHQTWGYNGSGFLWYGIEQPFVSRTFDVWSFESEGYFWEMKTAIEAENVTAMNNVLKKYDIDYILYDTSLLPIVANQKSLQYESINRMLKENDIIKKEQAWGHLTLYRINQQNKQEDFVSIAEEVPNIGPRIKMTNDDMAYSEYGTYQTDDTKSFDAYFPFLDLMTQTRHVSDKWEISERSASFAFSRSLPFSVHSYDVISSANAAINLYDEDTAVKYIVPLQALTKDSLVTLSFPKLRINSFNPETAPVGYCLKEQGELAYIKQDGSVRITTNNGATGCVEFKDTTLDQRYGYLVTIQNYNLEGPRLYFYILDSTKKQAYVEDRIIGDTEYYILGPHFSRGLGYSMTFQNISYDNISSSNIIEAINVYLMPYKELRSFALTRNGNEVPKASFLTSFTAEKNNYYTYTVTLPTSQKPRTLILFQAYQPGWRAYAIKGKSNVILNEVKNLFPFFFGSEITDHVAINNWANGWNISPTTHKPPASPAGRQPTTYVLIYLPQYLQYAGFVLLGTSLLTLGLTSIVGKNRCGKLDPDLSSGLTKTGKIGYN